MSFGQAVKSVFRQYASFSGRARRSEYWWYTLFASLVSLPGTIIFMIAYFSEIVPLSTSMDAQGNVSNDAYNNINWGVLGASYIPILVVGLALLLPGLAVVVRRLHDTGRSGWWYFISFVPFGSYVLLVFMFFDSQPYDNAYGPDPKAATRFPVGFPPQAYAQPAQLSYPAQPDYQAQPGYPAAPSAYPAQPGYPAAPSAYPAQPGYPTAPPPYTPPAVPPATNDPFATPSD